MAVSKSDHPGRLKSRNERRIVTHLVVYKHSQCRIIRRTIQFGGLNLSIQRVVRASTCCSTWSAPTHHPSLLTKVLNRWSLTCCYCHFQTLSINWRHGMDPINHFLFHRGNTESGWNATRSWEGLLQSLESDKQQVTNHVDKAKNRARMGRE